jgi:energy-coupling factor transporter transmembrane protein EcfT
MTSHGNAQGRHLALARPRLHAATRILLWLMLAASIGAWPAPQLLFGSAVLLPLLWRYGAAPFWRLLRRSRWLLLSLFGVYALATPGAPLWPDLPALSRAGLHAGALQTWRLVLLFAGIGLLQAVSAAEDLLYGLYVLLGKLKWLGVDAERIAIRIALTLQYAGQGKSARPRGWQAQLDQALTPAAPGGTVITLPPQPFTWRDGVALAGMAAMLPAFLVFGQAAHWLAGLF